MSQPASNQPVFIPYLTVGDGRAAIEWCGKVFGTWVAEGELFEMDDGRIGHATLNLGDGHRWSPTSAEKADLAATE